ncbi:MAG: hypothetical protein AAF646_09225 [Pseudomonadota bacterium]
MLWVGPLESMGELSERTLALAFPAEAVVCELSAVTLRDLEETLRNGETPDAVLSPLFWRGGDGVETAALLDQLDYANPYRIVTPVLPRPDLVLRELRAACPKLDIELIPFQKEERRA